MDQFTNVLPEDFDGVFRFTNPSTDEFIGKWGGKSYTYPAMSTVPMIIHDATPLEIQNIRKKFAKELAEREFFKSSKAASMTSKVGELNSIHQANVYAEADLAEWIQKCLTALPVAQPIIAETPKIDTEASLSRTPKGKLRTRVLDEDESLVDTAKGGNE